MMSGDPPSTAAAPIPPPRLRRLLRGRPRDVHSQFQLTSNQEIDTDKKGKGRRREACKSGGGKKVGATLP